MYEFHILLLKIYFFKYCLKISVPENPSDKTKIEIKSKNDPNRPENRVTLVEQSDKEIEQSLQSVLLEYIESLNKKVIGGRKNKRKKYTGNGYGNGDDDGDGNGDGNSDGTKDKIKGINVDIFELVNFIVDENNIEDEYEYEEIINRHICKELFNCEITSTGGNRINKIHKSLKELKTYAKKINITCSNKNKSELFKAIKQINLNNLKIDELKEYCKFFNIKGYSKYKNKKSLIKFINEHNI